MKLYLDVDGVVNALPLRKDRHLYERFEVGIFTISYQTDVLLKLAEMHKAGTVELVWLTTWEKEANDHLSGPLGLPQLETVQRSLYPESPWWKLNAIQHKYGDGESLIWIDDEILDFPVATEWLLHSTDQWRVKAISPDPQRGLTLDQLLLVEQWLV